MPDLRNIWILRSQDIQVNYSEDKWPMAYVDLGDIINRQKRTGFMRASSV